jgi:hypothetical protein
VWGGGERIGRAGFGGAGENSVVEAVLKYFDDRTRRDHLDHRSSFFNDHHRVRYS